MAGFLAYMAAGAAQGAGQGIVAEAKARREAAIAELEHGRTLAREQTDRDFRASENAKDRAATAEQGRLGRQTTMTDSNGDTLIVDGDRARPLTGPDGKPVRGLQDAKDQPADVQTAQWLIQQGVASDPSEAFKMVKSARAGTTTMADVEAMVEKRVDTELGSGFQTPSAEQVQESRSRNRREILQQLGMGEPASPASSGTAPASVSRPEGVSDAQLVQQAKDAIAAGADPAAIRSRLSSMGVDAEGAGL